MPETNMSEYLDHPIFPLLCEVASASDTACYVVGGYVRDRLMGRDFKNDIDVVVLGSGIDFATRVGDRLGAKVAVYKNFGTASLRHGELQLEFVGARKESYRADSRKPIVEDGTLADDQNRRDFTINAMALSLNEPDFGSLLDPFEGRQDIQNRIIRTPLDPDETFSDDPLRMMRAIRFATELNFKIDVLALKAIMANRGRISIISRDKRLETNGFEERTSCSRLRATICIAANTASRNECSDATFFPAIS